MHSPTITQPETLTVEEAAQVLRIGRTTAYALAREWRTTGGRSGLPVLELGRTLRVPRAALDRILDVGGGHHTRSDSGSLPGDPATFNGPGDDEPGLRPGQNPTPVKAAPPNLRAA